MYRFREAMELLLILGLVVACHVARNVQVVDLPVFDKEGHRGCRGLMPENTIPGMMKALELGVTTLEMDVVITKDHRVILSHEPFFNHEITTKPNGEYVTESEERNLNIYKMTLLETRQYDVGLKPHPRFPRQQKIRATKPLLREVIEDAEAYTRLKETSPVFYNIETKTNPETDGIYHPEPAEFVDLLMKVINRKKIADRVIIQSFDYRTLKIMNEKYPDVKTAALVEEDDSRSFREHLDELGFVPSIYSPAYKLVTKELVEECHRQQVKIVPWTVNDQATIEQLKALGVDGVITDHPELFQ